MSNANLNAPTDYQKLSELYGAFLGALGGVSITVLSIVMAFSIKNFRNDLRPYLIATLSAAAFSCFTGGHLMTETAAYISKSPEERTGARLCALATINIYISVVLIIFSLVLMVVGLSKNVAGLSKDMAGLNDQGATVLKWFFIFLFACVVTSAMIWMGLTIKTRLNAPNDAVWKAIFIVYCLSASWYAFLVIISYTLTLWMSLLFTVFCTFSSLAYFTKTFKRGDQFNNFDIYFFTSSITLSCLSIVVSCVKLLAFCENANVLCL